MMKDDLKNILFSEEKIKERVGEIGACISADYKGKSPILVGVLKGSFVFLADLARSIDLNCEIRFLSASSYGFSTVTKGTVNLGTLDFDVKDRDIILIEDILDSGVTLSTLKNFLSAYSPASVRICAFLDKAARRQVPINADYVGFPCPDEFVVGYGLDYAERYRGLPYVAVLKPEIYS